MESLQYDCVVNAIRDISMSKRSKKIKPSYVMYSELSEHLDKKYGTTIGIKDTLNTLFQQSKIKIYDTINGKGVELL